MYSLVLVTALVAALISYVIYRLVQFTRFKRTVNRVPGNPTHWLWGSLHEVWLESLCIWVKIWLQFQLSQWLTKYYINIAKYTHYNSVNDCCQFPGLNDEGLAFAVQVVVKYPRSHRAWFGPFKAQTYATHPDTAKEILRTTGLYTVYIGLHSKETR